MGKSARHSMAAHAMHSKHDSRVTSAPGRKAAAAARRKRLLDEVDPDRSLTEEERQRRYDHADTAAHKAFSALGVEARRKAALEAQA